MLNPTHAQMSTVKGTGVRLITDTHLNGIDDLLRFMRKVVHGKDNFYRRPPKPGSKAIAIVSSLGDHLNELSRYAALHQKGFVYHPLLQLFFDHFPNHILSASKRWSRHELLQGKFVWQHFDDLLLTLRRAAAVSGLKRKARDWEAKPKRNRRKLRILEKRAFERHSRLAVCRLDLEYLAADITNAEFDELAACGDIDPTRFKVAFETVQEDRIRLFRNMKGKPSLFEHLVAYVWRIECTPLAGYHLHLVLLFDGREVYKHKWLTGEIGRYWENEITGGRGRFHNVNARWDESDPNCGIGIINRSDEHKRKRLREAVLPYLAKNEQLVQVLPYPGCKLTSSGFRHRKKTRKQTQTP